MDPSIQYFRYPKISDDLFDPESKVGFKWILIRHVQQKIDFQKILHFLQFLLLNGSAEFFCDIWWPITILVFAKLLFFAARPSSQFYLSFSIGGFL